MPYSSISELPSEVRGRYSVKQLQAFRAAFNAAMKEGKSEAQAFKIAHSAAQVGGKPSEKKRESAAVLATRAGARVRARPAPRQTDVQPVADELDDLIADNVPVEGRQTSVELPGFGDLSQRAFLTEANGRTILTGPAVPKIEELEKAWTPNPAFMWLQGKFVGAEKANRNGALWTTADLQMGEPTVRHGPLNWLHEDHKIIGTIAESHFVHAPLVEGAAETLAEPYIAVAAAVWRFLWPQEGQIIEMASEQERLWFSMECVSRQVSCADHDCGTWTYLEAQTAATGVCEHVARKTGTRRFVDPIFTGGACIVPPVRPGWPEARAGVMRQAAAQAADAFEQAGRPDVAAADWEKLMGCVLSYAGVEG